MNLFRRAQMNEARLYLRWASQDLTGTERVAIGSFLAGGPDREAADEIDVTRGAIWMARKSAFVKMRRRLAQLEIRRTEDLL